MRPYRDIVEAALPPFLIFGMQNKMIKLGYPQTPGIMHAFVVAIRTAFDKAPVIERDIPRIEVTALCNELVSGLSPDDPRDLLLACLSFMPMLAENGLHGTLSDPLPKLCLQEIRDFAILGQWNIDDAFVTHAAMRMLMRARLAGYYLNDGPRGGGE